MKRLIAALIGALVIGFAYFAMRPAAELRSVADAPRQGESSELAPPPAPQPAPTATAAAPANASREEQADGSRIVNGETANPADFPWIAAIGWKEGEGVKAYCAGTLVAPQWLLTAAHCKVLVGDAVVLGRSDLSKTDVGHVIEVARVVPNPEYDSHTLDHDLALLRLATPVDIATLRLVDSDELAMRRATEISIAGWGKLGELNYQLPNELQKANVNLSSRESCVTNYQAIDKVITDNMFCAQGLRPASQGGGITDACQGDSGGPIVAIDRFAHTTTLIGVISKGSGCARPQYPGVYARLSKLRAWVLQCTADPEHASCRQHS